MLDIPLYAINSIIAEMLYKKDIPLYYVWKLNKKQKEVLLAKLKRHVKVLES